MNMGWQAMTSLRKGPFSQLQSMVQQAGLRLKPNAAAPGGQPDDRRAPSAAGEDEGKLFEQAMSGVRRAHWRARLVSSPPPALKPSRDPELEDARLMRAAICGDPALSVSDHPEYIEGWIGVAGKRYLPDLRNGMYSIQGQLDLHGLTRDQAKRAVEEFIAGMSRFRACCVKIIHGRGINSPQDKAILKESLQRWLSTRRMSRHVVAYASAPLCDGGVGAVYVLLHPKE